jgi:C-terminal processing protease CtpA/Prc
MIMKRISKELLIVGLALALCFGLATAKSGKGGKVAWMGVYTQTVDRELADVFDLSIKYGAIVNEVVEDSPADEAGVKEDDVIIEINGSRITDSDELTDEIHEMEPGDEIVIKIMRENNEQEITLALGSRKLKWSGLRDIYEPGRHSYSLSYFSEDQSYIGVSITGLSKQLGEYFGVDDGAGVLITEVEEESPAEEAGLKAGDVIIAVDGEETENSSDLQEIIREREEGEKVTVSVVRDKNKKEFAVEIGERDDVGFPYSLRIPDLPRMNFHIPRMKGLHRGTGSDDVFLFDSDDFEDDMNELREELEQLKKELRELSKSKR